MIETTYLFHSSSQFQDNKLLKCTSLLSSSNKAINEKFRPESPDHEYLDEILYTEEYHITCKSLDHVAQFWTNFYLHENRSVWSSAGLFRLRPHLNVVIVSVTARICRLGAFFFTVQKRALWHRIWRPLHWFSEYKEGPRDIKFSHTPVLAFNHGEHYRCFRHN